MVIAEAVIQTEHPDRYLARLCKHAGQMGRQLHHQSRRHGGGQALPEMQRAECSGSHGTVSLSWGQWTMQAAAVTLTLRAEAADETNLQRIQDVLTTRLAKLGRRGQLTGNRQPTGTSVRQFAPR